MKIALNFPKDSEGIFDSSLKGKFGGATVRIYELAEELSKRKNISVMLLYPDAKDKPCLINATSFITFALKDSFLKKIIKFHQAINKAKPEFVMQYGLAPSVPFLYLYFLLRGIKFIYVMASDKEAEEKYQESGKKCILFPLLMQNKINITQTRYQYVLLRKKYQNIYFVNKGIKPLFFKEMNREFILWVGRGVEIKRPEKYFELARRFEKETFVMIMPEGENLSYHKKIRNEADGLKNVKFIKYVPYQKINEYFRKSKLFINTSEYEALPNTFFESAMAGTPILSLKVNPNNMFSKGIGYCCRDEMKEMFNVFEKLITDKKEYEEMSCNIIKFGDQFHIRRNVDEILELIKK